MDQGTLHIAMLPWLALGHLLPFLELSKQLAEKGHQISFLSTPKNIQILPPLPPNLSSLINLVELPLPFVEHLPQNAEATIDLPSDDLRPYLKKAYDTLHQNLSDFLHDPSHPTVDWLIYDYAAHWAPRIAAECGVSCSFFSLFNASVLGFYGPTSALMGKENTRMTAEEFTVVPSWVPFHSTIAYRGYEARELLELATLPDVSGVTEGYRFAAAIEGCEFVAVRSCVEFEPEWLTLLNELYQKPVVPIGMLPPMMIQEEEDSTLFKWLDEQEEGSVVYVAFGSEAKITSAQVAEIALGLESSKLPFVWALRASKLPDGFESLDDRTRDRGIVCMDWVPQARVLAHPSVGGFLTHGGWNSIVEGLAFGVAMVVLPLVFDQGLNARNLVGRRIAVEVPRKEEDGSFTGESIAEYLRLVMVEEEGKAFRIKAKECQKMFGEGEMQDRWLGDFVNYLWDHRQKKAVLRAV